ncbi:uncharacterized protein METZ01_LOCUS13380 [marine metagenome]|uniref:Uncharacterized protein n=1 Tax=marine metagenome TaxID=408172 RepID=A0A381P0S3_9ZZZZ
MMVMSGLSSFRNTVAALWLMLSISTTSRIVFKRAGMMVLM